MSAFSNKNLVYMNKAMALFQSKDADSILNDINTLDSNNEKEVIEKISEQLFDLFENTTIETKVSNKTKITLLKDAIEKNTSLNDWGKPIDEMIKAIENLHSFKRWKKITVNNAHFKIDILDQFGYENIKNKNIAIEKIIVADKEYEVTQEKNSIKVDGEVIASYTWDDILDFTIESNEKAKEIFWSKKLSLQLVASKEIDLPDGKKTRVEKSIEISLDTSKISNLSLNKDQMEQVEDKNMTQEVLTRAVMDKIYTLFKWVEENVDSWKVKDVIKHIGVDKNDVFTQSAKSNENRESVTHELNEESSEKYIYDPTFDQYYQVAEKTFLNKRIDAVIQDHFDEVLKEGFYSTMENTDSKEWKRVWKNLSEVQKEHFYKVMTWQKEGEKREHYKDIPGLHIDDIRTKIDFKEEIKKDIYNKYLKKDHDKKSDGTNSKDRESNFIKDRTRKIWSSPERLKKYLRDNILPRIIEKETQNFEKDGTNVHRQLNYFNDDQQAKDLVHKDSVSQDYSWDKEQEGVSGDGEPGLVIQANVWDKTHMVRNALKVDEKRRQQERFEKVSKDNFFVRRATNKFMMLLNWWNSAQRKHVTKQLAAAKSNNTLVEKDEILQRQVAGDIWRAAMEAWMWLSEWQYALEKVSLNNEQQNKLDSMAYNFLIWRIDKDAARKLLNKEDMWADEWLGDDAMVWTDLLEQLESMREQQWSDFTVFDKLRWYINRPADALANDDYTIMKNTLQGLFKKNPDLHKNLKNIRIHDPNNIRTNELKTILDYIKSQKHAAALSQMKIRVNLNQVKVNYNHEVVEDQMRELGKISRRAYWLPLIWSSLGFIWQNVFWTTWGNLLLKSALGIGLATWWAWLFASFIGVWAWSMALQYIKTMRDFKREAQQIQEELIAGELSTKDINDMVERLKKQIEDAKGFQKLLSTFGMWKIGVAKKRKDLYETIWKADTDLYKPMSELIQWLQKKDDTAILETVARLIAWKQLKTNFLQGHSRETIEHERLQLMRHLKMAVQEKSSKKWEMGWNPITSQYEEIQSFVPSMDASNSEWKAFWQQYVDDTPWVAKKIQDLKDKYGAFSKEIKKWRNSRALKNAGNTWKVLLASWALTAGGQALMSDSIADMTWSYVQGENSTVNHKLDSGISHEYDLWKYDESWRPVENMPVWLEDGMIVEVDAWSAVDSLHAWDDTYDAVFTEATQVEAWIDASDLHETTKETLKWVITKGYRNETILPYLNNNDIALDEGNTELLFGRWLEWWEETAKYLQDNNLHNVQITYIQFDPAAVGLDIQDTWKGLQGQVHRAFNSCWVHVETVPGAKEWVPWEFVPYPYLIPWFHNTYGMPGKGGKDKKASGWSGKRSEGEKKKKVKENLWNASKFKIKKKKWKESIKFSLRNRFEQRKLWDLSWKKKEDIMRTDHDPQDMTEEHFTKRREYDQNHGSNTSLQEKKDRYITMQWNLDALKELDEHARKTLNKNAEIIYAKYKKQMNEMQLEDSPYGKDIAWVRRHLAKELGYFKKKNKQNNESDYPLFDPTENIAEKNIQRIIDVHIGWELEYKTVDEIKEWDSIDKLHKDIDEKLFDGLSNHEGNQFKNLYKKITKRAFQLKTAADPIHVKSKEYQQVGQYLRKTNWFDAKKIVNDEGGGSVGLDHIPDPIESVGYKNIKNFDKRISVDWKEAILNFAKIAPYLVPVDGKFLFTGMTWRLFVLMNLNGENVPFYMSSNGTDGKQVWKWYPYRWYNKWWIAKKSNKNNSLKNATDTYENGYWIPEIQFMQNLLNKNIQLNSIPFDVNWNIHNSGWEKVADINDYIPHFAETNDYEKNEAFRKKFNELIWYTNIDEKYPNLKPLKRVDHLNGQEKKKQTDWFSAFYTFIDKKLEKIIDNRSTKDSNNKIDVFS